MWRISSLPFSFGRPWSGGRGRTEGRERESREVKEGEKRKGRGRERKEGGKEKGRRREGQRERERSYRWAGGKSNVATDH